MKKKTIILVDGENISAENADKIVTASTKLGVVAERKVYHRLEDQSTRAWTEKTKSGDYKDILLYGGPAKNKVDRKMQKDARLYMKDPDVVMVCVVSSDGGFRCLAEDAAAAGKKLCFIGGKTPSRKLRNTGAQFMKLR